LWSRSRSYWVNWVAHNECKKKWIAQTCAIRNRLSSEIYSRADIYKVFHEVHIVDIICNEAELVKVRFYLPTLLFHDFADENIFDIMAIVTRVVLLWPILLSLFLSSSHSYSDFYFVFHPFCCRDQIPLTSPHFLSFFRFLSTRCLFDQHLTNISSCHPTLLQGMCRLVSFAVFCLHTSMMITFTTQWLLQHVLWCNDPFCWIIFFKEVIVTLRPSHISNVFVPTPPLTVHVFLLTFSGCDLIYQGYHPSSPSETCLLSEDPRFAVSSRQTSHHLCVAESSQSVDVNPLRLSALVVWNISSKLPLPSHVSC